MNDHLEAWGGLLRATRFDEETGAFFVIAIHSLARGPAAGGTRAMQYASSADAVADASRLAEAMSLKLAIAGLPLGGGKSVIALPAPRSELAPSRWKRILELHAQNVATFGGNYFTGPDIGTTSADMDVLHARCGYAAGRSPASGGPGSSAPSTARGVYAAIKRSVTEAGMGEVAGLTILVQGLGAVGFDVARLASVDGARLLVADVDDEVSVRATEVGADVISADRVLKVASDVFVPCATGGVIDSATAASIQTRVVAGAANNVLADPAAAGILRARGIVYAPDFVANAGGAIDLIGREVLGWSVERVAQHVEGIGDTLGNIFDEARAQGLTTDDAARRLAAERLSEGAGRIEPMGRLALMHEG
ncbi:Glu/Leu/Phe/Val dehydrogenase family protein [Nocardioides jensenii]|uniref:Glu/Leu/Phe/Val dehydrogenase family protein n=1 Tax=Nocardioides jensenii TaxID=1843 RepID=UPI00082A66A5|nr:Glu/Leu/Phe/Val dehydrogenase dimerization domain-containing protein [Nocardioides jensenii]